MELPETIALLDVRRVREMFKNFTAQEADVDWNDGAPVVNARRMTPDFIAEQLDVAPDEAQRIHATLVGEDWLESEKFTPTRKGMALSQHVDRPRLQRADAESLLAKVLDWADRTNTEAHARVKVKTIHLYGSLLGDTDEVGDVDLFVEFTTMDLGMDLQPEDMEREDGLSEELIAISDYLSPSSWVDRELMGDVPMRQVFPRRD